ncbi:MAG: DUF1801 domain-containing protein [Planctomycetota bacterium]
MEALFRVDGARRHDPAIAAWLRDQASPLGALAELWFARLRACGADVVELIHDGCPVACVADAPFAYVNVFTAHVNVGFFRGAALADPAGLLRGTGKRMRHVKLRPESSGEGTALQELIDAAYRDIREGLAGTQH